MFPVPALGSSTFIPGRSAAAFTSTSASAGGDRLKPVEHRRRDEFVLNFPLEHPTNPSDPGVDDLAAKVVLDHLLSQARSSLIASALTLVDASSKGPA